MNIDYTFNPHQKEFFYDLKSRLLHLSTGFGGGKTYGLSAKCIQLSYLNAPYNGGMVAPDFQEFKKDWLPEMELILETNKIPYRYHKTEHWFEFPWGTKAYVVSADKAIRGPNWAWAGINELTLMPLVRYKEVMGRVRVKGSKYPQIASVGTPEGYASEYYDYMIENPVPDLRIIYGSTLDNIENLHSNYISLLESAYDKAMREAYIQGLWVNMTGNRFYYAYDPKKQWDEKLKPDANEVFHCSMDFNVDPFCATLWHFDGWKIDGVDQVELKGGEGYDTKKMMTALISRGYNPSNTIIYPDPAGNARSTKGKPDIKQLEEVGFTVRYKSVAPRMRARQLLVNNLLDKGRIKFNPKVCKGIKKDLEAVEQDILTLEKVKKNLNLTHFSDGLDNMCEHLFPTSGSKPTFRTERIR